MKNLEDINSYFTNDERRKFPSIVNLEVFRGKCPCRCIHCPVGRMEIDEREEFYGIEGISKSLYRKVIDEVSQHPQSALRIHSVGEPLLWDDLRAFIQYAHSKNVQLWLFTSLLTNNIELLKELCEKVRIIEVSINNINEEEYLLEKGVSGFEIVKNNMKIMREYIDKYELDCRVLVSRVQTASLQKDTEFLEYWKKMDIADDVFVRSFHTYNHLIEERFDIRERSRGCLVHWLRFNISVKGIAVVCFNELFKKEISDEIKLGDINYQSISEIWQSEYLNNIRNCDLNGLYISKGFSSDFPCIKCTSCNSIKTATNISENQLNKSRKVNE